MWEQGARRRARLLFAALCVSVTLIHGYAFNRYTSDLHGRTRNASDWLETLVRFTPFFGAVHGISYVAYARLIGDAASSSKKTSPHWFASHVVSMAHAIVVTAVALHNLAHLWHAPAAVKLGTRHLPAGSVYAVGYPRVAAVGELFSAWLLYDLVAVVGAWRVLGSWETIAHHVGFMGASAVLRGLYFAPWQATVCLCMEASTPFLNLCSLKEALGLSKSSAAVVGSFGAFALNFFVFRIVLLGGALAQLVLRWADGPWLEPPPDADAGLPPVPSWAPLLLVAMLVGAFAMMLMWFRRIVLILVPGAAGVGEGKGPGGATKVASEDEGEVPTPLGARRSTSEEELTLVA